MIDVLPNELLVNDAGVVVLFSMRLHDGVVNLVLRQKRDASKRAILEFFKDWIEPIGLHIVGSKIQEKYEGKSNIKLVAYLIDKYGPTVINPIVDSFGNYFNGPDYGYYEVTSGELVFDHAIRLNVH